MNHILRNSAFILLALLLLNSCNDEPVFSIVPEITFVSITPEQATQFTPDEVQLTLSYQDGDGDLGYEGEATPNLFVEDTRAAFAGNPGRISSYSVESLTPSTRKPSIQGNITITMPTPIYESSEEPLVFRVYIVDRAGNSSNVIETTPITILP
ncbi:MAG: hypothetical protein AAGN35_07600 [Bacteroidota bacterium]